jgi:hypothetical protein
MNTAAVRNARDVKLASRAALDRQAVGQITNSEPRRESGSQITALGRCGEHQHGRAELAAQRFQAFDPSARGIVFEKRVLNQMDGLSNVTPQLPERARRAGR